VKNYTKILLLFSLLTLSAGYFGYGQSKQYVVLNEFGSLVFNTNSKNTIDSNSCNDVQEKVINNFHLNGYCEAAMDSINLSCTPAKLFVFLGKQYQNFDLRIKDTTVFTILENPSKLDKRKLTNLKLGQVIHIQELILTQFENQGYPFCATQLDSIQLTDSKVSAILNIEKGALISFDSLIIENLNTRPDLIKALLKLKKGQPYSEYKTLSMDKDISTLPFTSISKPTELLIINNKCYYKIYIQNQRANQIDALIGFESEKNNAKSINLTGYLNLDLLNALHHGEQLKLKWESIGNQSQNLETFVYYPYLLGSSLSTSLGFSMEKMDTQYLNLQFEPTLFYNLNAFDQIGIYGHFFSSTSTLQSSQSLIQNSNYNGAGIHWLMNHLDYFFNPRQGYKIQIKADLGNKTKVNDNNQNPMLYRANTAIEIFLPIKDRSTVLLSNKFGLIESSTLFSNELYLIGGSQNLRGFNEKQILSSLFLIQTVEYRWLLDRNSHLAMFYDYGLIENTVEQSYSGNYNGFGLGMSFVTNLGIFKISYALGKLPHQDIQFRNSKIHFGYSALF
jgi:hypothetical protein